VNLETVARLLYRCEVVEIMHLKRSFSMIGHVQEAVTQLYVDIISSLSKLVKYFNQAFAGMIYIKGGLFEHGTNLARTAPLGCQSIRA
jgi:hypothetical protein